jgi:hypothetical protein
VQRLEERNGSRRRRKIATAHRYIASSGSTEDLNLAVEIRIGTTQFSDGDTRE